MPIDRMDAIPKTKIGKIVNFWKIIFDNCRIISRMQISPKIYNFQKFLGTIFRK